MNQGCDESKQPQDSLIRYKFTRISSDKIRFNIQAQNKEVMTVQILSPNLSCASLWKLSNATNLSSRAFSDSSKEFSTDNIDIGTIELTFDLFASKGNLNIGPEDMGSCFPSLQMDQGIYFRGVDLLPRLRFFDTEGKIIHFDDAEISFNGFPITWRLATDFHSLLDVPAENRLLVARVMFGDISIVEQQLKSGVILKVVKFKYSPSNDNFKIQSTEIEAIFNAMEDDLGLYQSSEYYVFEIETYGSSPNDFVVGSASRTSQVLFHSPTKDSAHVLQVASHEIAHSWVPHSLYRTSLLRQKRWTREGFAEYFGLRAVTRSGLVHSDNVIVSINKRLERYSMNSQDPYDFGFVAAWALDDGVSFSEATSKLSRYVRFDALGNLQEHIQTFQSEEHIIPIHKKLLEFIKSKNNAPLFTDVLKCEIDIQGHSYIKIHTEWPEYKLGFTLQYSKLGVEEIGIITNVTDRSHADIAGIKPGDRLIKKISGGDGNIHKQLILLLRGVDGFEKVASFYPHGKLSNIKYSQYVLKSKKGSYTRGVSKCIH